MCDCQQNLNNVNEVIGITNLHHSGDPKKMTLVNCKNCNESALAISLKTKTYNGEMNSTYKLDINDDEKERLIDIMNRCPSPENEDWCCESHDLLDEFENSHQDKMELLETNTMYL